jgi:hypothetical protein
LLEKGKKYLLGNKKFCLKNQSAPTLFQNAVAGFGYRSKISMLDIKTVVSLSALPESKLEGLFVANGRAVGQN